MYRYSYSGLVSMVMILKNNQFGLLLLFLFRSFALVCGAGSQVAVMYGNFCVYFSHSFLNHTMIKKIIPKAKPKLTKPIKASNALSKFSISFEKRGIKVGVRFKEGS